MKCEIKYIKNTAKKDFKSLTIGSLLGTVLLSSLIVIMLNLVFTSKIVHIIITLAFLTLIIVVWFDAMDYCKIQKTKMNLDMNVGLRSKNHEMRNKIY